jgi:hypothetical protein
VTQVKRKSWIVNLRIRIFCLQDLFYSEVGGHRPGELRDSIKKRAIGYLKVFNLVVCKRRLAAVDLGLRHGEAAQQRRQTCYVQ